MTAGKIMEFPLSPPAGSFVDGTKSLAKCISEQSPKVSKMQKGHGTLDCCNICIISRKIVYISLEINAIEGIEKQSKWNNKPGN